MPFPRSTTAALLAAVLLSLPAPAAARGIAPDVQARLTRADGRPLRAQDTLTLGDGTRITAEAYQRVLEGWATRLRERRRVDASGRALPLLDQPSVDRARRAAGEARQRAAARGAIPARPLDLTLLPGRGRTARLPLTATRSERHAGSWGESWGDRAWVALRLEASEELVSATHASTWAARFSATATVLGRDLPVAAGDLLATSGSAHGFTQAWLDLAGQTYWAQPATDGAPLDVGISRRWTRTQRLAEVTFVVLFVPVKVEVGLQGRVGLEARVRASNRLADPLARGALRTLSVVSTQASDAGRRVDGAWSDLSLYATANALTSLREVAAELGIERLLETIDLVPGVDVPWSQPLAGASLDLRVRLLALSFSFWAGDRLEYAESGPGSARWSLAGSLLSALEVRALADPTVHGSAFVSYPSGVDVDFVWGIPPVEVTIEWNRVSARERLWGWSGALFELAFPLDILSWETVVQRAGGAL